MAAPDFPTPSFPVYDQPVQIVQGLIAEMDARIASFTAKADDVFDALQTLPDPDIGTPPTLIADVVPTPTFPTIPPPNPKIFGTVDELDIPPYDGIDPSITTLAAQLLADLQNIPTFSPTVGAPNIPDAPPDPLPIDWQGLVNDKPTIETITLPVAPDLNDPGPGELVPYTIPVLPTITLPHFDANIPTFDDDPPSAALSWSEPLYTPTVRAEVTAAIKGMLVGDFAMPDKVLIALLGQSRDKELMTTRKQVDEAMSVASSRGFAMPQGFEIEQINIAQQEGALRENDRTREIIKLKGDWANENLRRAITEGIALEAQLLNYFIGFCQRTFDAAKFAVDSQRLLFDSKVGLFRARNEQLNVLCTVFETQFKEAMAPLEVVRVELQNQQLIGTINQQTMQAYQIRVSALELLARRFETLMNGAKIKSEIQKDRVDAWRGEIEAFTAMLNAEKIPFEIYETRVRGEATKATVLEAEAGAFRATVDAFSAGENIKIAVLQGNLKAIDSATQRFVATVGAQRDRVATQGEAIRAEASAYSADIGRFDALLRFAGTAAQVTVQSQEANVRNNLAYAEIKSRQYDAAAARIIQIAQLKLQGIDAAGKIATGLGAGAMSAQHVQASVSGSGSASTSSGYSYSEVHSFDETT